MKVPTKFVTGLSPAEVEQLVEQHRSHRSFRVRNRSHAVLLSFGGAAVDDIAAVCRVDRDTVSGWLDLWNESKFDGLQDSARSGRPKTLTKAEEAQAVTIALENPRFPARQISAIKAATGKQISERMLKALLKKKAICGNGLS